MKITVNNRQVQLKPLLEKPKAGQFNLISDGHYDVLVSHFGYMFLSDGSGSSFKDGGIYNDISRFQDGNWQVVVDSIDAIDFKKD